MFKATSLALGEIHSCSTCVFVSKWVSVCSFACLYFHLRVFWNHYNTCLQRSELQNQNHTAVCRPAIPLKTWAGTLSHTLTHTHTLSHTHTPRGRRGFSIGHARHPQPHSPHSTPSSAEFWYFPSELFYDPLASTPSPESKKKKTLYIITPSVSTGTHGQNRRLQSWDFQVRVFPSCHQDDVGL